jgi:signal transduction histidine kinase
MQGLLINEDQIKGSASNKWVSKNDYRSIIGYPNNLSSIRLKIKKEKEELYSMMKILSHDIRSPLVSMGAALTLVNKGSYGSLDKGVSSELDRLIGIVTHTTGILEDFMARASSLDGTLDISGEILNIREDIAYPVIMELKKRIQEKGIILFNHGYSSGDEGDTLTTGNRFLLKAVFRNLFNNAIKYGGKGCKISYSINKHGSFHRITFFNSGEPVPEKDRHKLFEKFRSINRVPNKMNDSMGLGLYLVKDIIQRHGGRIWYEACEKGSKFIFTLPRLEENGIRKSNE